MFNALREKRKKRIYLDFAAATPVHPDVLQAMLPYFSEAYGNPSGIHKEAQRTKDAVDNARQTLATMLRVRPEDVTFTSGGTESNNLAIYGTLEALLKEGRTYLDMEVITTRIEHPSVIEVMKVLEERGVTVRYVRVDGEGRIDIPLLESLLNDKTALVTFAYANSEIGVVQDIKRISRIVRKYNTDHACNIKVHVDGAQAPLWLPCQMDMLGINLLTLDAGKCYGPKGVGALVHRNVKLVSQLLGGNQESGRRAGTENVPLIVGCTAAIVRAQEGMAQRCEKVTVLRDEMLTQIHEALPDAIVNGSLEHRIANNVNISLPGYDSEYAVVVLDTKGVAASTRSACSGADGAGSHVVRTIADEARATSTVRFTLGEETTAAEISCAVQILKEYSESMRTVIERE